MKTYIDNQDVMSEDGRMKNMKTEITKIEQPTEYYLFRLNSPSSHIECESKTIADAEAAIAMWDAGQPVADLRSAIPSLVIRDQRNWVV